MRILSPSLPMDTRCDKAIAYLKGTFPLSGGERTFSKDDSPVVSELAADISCFYVVDEGTSFRYVQYRDMEHEGYTLPRLHEGAVERLRKIAQEKLQVFPVPGEYFAAIMGGNFEASLILLDGLWNKSLRRLIKNDFIVALPARDILAFCDSKSERGRASLKQIVDRTWPRGDHLISRNLYRRSGNAWKAVD